MTFYLFSFICEAGTESTSIAAIYWPTVRALDDRLYSFWSN
jgi:hypothetical protein